MSGGVTGSVDLYIHDRYQTTAQLDSSGVATIPNLFGNLGFGSYSARAVYTGDVNFDTASAATTININTGTDAPTLTLVCDPAALSPGSGASCTAQAPAGATGSVSFFISGNEWTSVPLDGNGQATAIPSPSKNVWDLSIMPVGSYSVVAYYSGDQNFSSTSAGVTIPIQTTKPVPSMSVSCTPSALVTGSLATCTASVGQGATGPVFGLQGQPNTGLSLDPNGNVIFQNQLPGASPASYTLQASYSGDINFSPASATTTVVVSSQQSAPAMTASITPSVIRNGDSVSVAVSVGGGATGSVEMLFGATHYATLPLDSTGSFVGAQHLTTPGDGSWILTLNYSGDANYLPVTRTVQITTSTQPMTLSCSPNTITSGGSTSCTAQVSGATTGTISEYLDGALEGTSGVDPSGSVAITVPTTSLASGTHTVTASYFLPDQTLSGTASQSIIVNSGSTQPSGYSYSITDSNGNSGYDADGNVVAYTDLVSGTWSNLTYDSLNRLSMGSQTPVSGPPQFFCWSYDSFGNRANQAVSSQSFSNSPGSSCQTSGTLYSNIVTTPNANNQIQSSNASGTAVTPGYDAAGNVTYDGSNQYLYDDEGRVCAVQTTSAISASMVQYVQYIYDAEGRRVAKGTINSLSCDLSSNNFTLTNSYALDLAGQQVTETGNSGNWLHTNIYAMGQLLATYNDQGVHFHISDWLGSRRMQTDYQGNVESTYTNLPFGEMPPSQSLGVTEQHFTGKERDSESGADYFGARYYGSFMGRFMSPDWASKPQPVPYASLMNPQSLNLYAYVNNNPLSQVDADGHFASPWHFLLTFVAAIATGHDPIHAAIWGVKNAGVDFRKGSQSGNAADTHIHAMGAAGETASQAYAGTAQTLSSEEASGDIGGAQHTIQDSYASGHDYSEWAPQNGPFGGLGFWGTVKHELGDWLPSPGALWGALNGSIDELRDPGASPGSTLHPTPAPGGTNGMPQCIGCFVPPGYTPKPPSPPPIDPEKFHTVSQ